MAKLESYIKGDEIKFAIETTGEGFDLTRDDFSVEVKSGKTSVVGYKNPEPGAATDVVIFKETVVVPPEEEGGESSEKDEWFAIVDTQKLEPGKMTVIMTAKVPDVHANDGIRNNICTADIGILINP